MKINFILPFKRMSGGIRVVYIYANYLAEQGHEVCCYVPMLSYRGKGQSILFRIKASLSNIIKKENWFDCKFPVKIVPLIRENFIEDADVVIATAWQTAFDVNKLSEKKGRKYYFIQDYEVFNGNVSDVEKTYSLGINMITISKKLQSKLLNFSNDVSIVYNGLYDSEYIRGEKKHLNKFTIMLMYHEAEHKCTTEGLEVIRKIKEKYDNIQIIIFGRKINEKFDEDYIVEESPEREKLMELYQMADVYLFTSKIEAWGLPIVEAMANKCAVIGRKIGALYELYDGKNAIIANDINEMYGALEVLYKNRLCLYKIQDAAYCTAKKLSWKKSAQKFESIILK